MTKIDTTYLDAWFAGQVRPPLKFGPNTTVRLIIDGKAEVGKVAYPITAKGDPTYMVELTTGDEIAVNQSELTSLDD